MRCVAVTDVRPIVKHTVAIFGQLDQWCTFGNMQATVNLRMDSEKCSTGEQRGCCLSAVKLFQASQWWVEAMAIGSWRQK